MPYERPAGRADRGELLAGDPLRAGRQADRPGAGGGVPGGGGRAIGCSRGRRRRGRRSASTCACPSENGAQRQRRALAQGASIEDVYAAEVAETQRTYAAEEVDAERAAAPTRSSCAKRCRELKVEDVVLQTVVTLVNLGGRRLTVEEREGHGAGAEGDRGRSGAAAALPRGGGPRRSRTRSPSSRCSTSRRPTSAAKADAPRPGAEDLDARLVIGDLRRLGLLPVPRRCRGGAGGHALRAAVGAASGSGEMEGARGGVHAASRRRAHAAAAPHQLPRQRLGDEGGRGPPDRRPVRLRVAQAGARARARS